jgi:hypothetical protein
VDQVIGKIADQNFFPSEILNDMQAIVDQEIANLDKMAMPFLVDKLLVALDDPAAVKNAVSFIIGIASKRDPDIRTFLVKKLIVPKSSNSYNSGLFSALIRLRPGNFAIAGRPCHKTSLSGLAAQECGGVNQAPISTTV